MKKTQKVVHFGAWPERNPQNQANFEGGRIKRDASLMHQKWCGWCILDIRDWKLETR